MIACVAKCNGFPQNVVRILRSAKLDFLNGLQSETGAFWRQNGKQIEFIIYAKTKIAKGCLHDKFSGKRLFPYFYQGKISFFEFRRNVRNVTETGAANHISYKKQAVRHVRPICFW